MTPSPCEAIHHTKHRSNEPMTRPTRRRSAGGSRAEEALMPNVALAVEAA
jgi:hypothetical protein